MTAPGPTEPKPSASPQAPATPSAATTASIPAVGKTPTPAQPPQPPRPPAPAKPAKPSAAAGAYLLAIVALLLAVGAGAGAALAWKTAQDLKDANAAAAQTVTATVTTLPTSTETTPPTSPTTPTVAPTTPAASSYVAIITRADVPVVPGPSGCLPAYVDVDTANVGISVAQYHDFYFSTCQGSLRVHVDRTSGRSASGADPTPDACGSLVAGTPTTELVLDATLGLTFCLLTNSADAAAQALPQRLAIVEVIAIAPQVRIALSVYHKAA